MYYSDKETDEKLKKLENKIKREYSRAYTEMKETANEYFDKFADRFAEEYEAYQKGKYTDNEFKAWYKTQIERGEGYNTMANKLAQRITDANLLVSAYINDATPSIYSLNRDYEAYRINEAYGLDFQLTDEMTIRRLMGNANHVEFKTTGVNRIKDYEWNRKQINSALTAGILQGKSIDKLADSYMVVMKRNRNSAIRNARTSFTSAQNAGRIETYYRAENMGITVDKEWIATHDGRTRDSHASLDGERVPYNDIFSNGLRYPADPEGAPAEVYNCRCTMRAILPKINDGKVNKSFSKLEQNKTKLIEEYNDPKYKNIFTIDPTKLTPNMVDIMTTEDLSQQMLKINYLAGGYVGTISNWNGIAEIVEDLDSYGKYDPVTNKIMLAPNAPLKSKFHEILHGYCEHDSISHLSIKEVKAVRLIEDGAVELMAEEICANNGIIVKNITYKDMVEDLKALANKKNMSYIEISREIISTPRSKMISKIEEIENRN